MLKRKRKTKRIPLQLKRHPAINIGKKSQSLCFCGLQMSNYGIGGYYGMHYDAFGVRLVIIICYHIKY